MLLVQAAAGDTLAGIIERIRNDLPGESPVIIRLPVENPIDPQVWDNADDPTAQRYFGNRARLVNRTRNRSVHVLSSFDGQPYLTAALNVEKRLDELAAFDRPTLLEQLREAEFNHLIVRSKAMLAAPPGSQFRAPSGYIVSNFVRVGNIQADRDALDAVAFWMLEHLCGCDAIVTDTWSISSIAINAARVASEYFQRRAPRVEMLPGYNDGSEAAILRACSILERVANDVGYAPEQETKILILISATQTGSLAGYLDHACRSATRAITPSFLALFALQESEIPRLSGMADDSRFAFEQPRTDDPSIIEIDPQVYFPLSYVDVPYRLARKDAERHREFFDAYERTKVVKVHADEDRADSVSRHHAIRLDLLEVLSIGRFSERLNAVLDTFSPQKAILAPGHEAGRSFAKTVARRLRKRHGDISVLPIPGAESVAQTGDRLVALEMLRAAGDHDEFVTLDDFSADTARLAQIDKQLRTLGFDGRVNYIVGILTHEDPAEWDGFVRRTVRRDPHPPHTISAIEHVPLPNIGRDGCPWCAEQALYGKWAQADHALPPTLENRRARLMSAGVCGLSEDVLLHPEELPRPALGPKSFYVRQRATQAHALCAASAALQTLRVEGLPNKPKLGPRHYPIATVLDHEDYLDQKWTDTVLRASFLRAATMDELVWTQTDMEKKRRQHFGNLLRRNSAAEFDLVLEILIASACGKVTLDLDNDQLRRTIGSRTIDGSAAYLFERLKEARR